MYHTAENGVATECMSICMFTQLTLVRSGSWILSVFFWGPLFFLAPSPLSGRHGEVYIVIVMGFDGVSMTAKICPQGKRRLHQHHDIYTYLSKKSTIPYTTWFSVFAASCGSQADRTSSLPVSSPGWKNGQVGNEKTLSKYVKKITGCRCFPVLIYIVYIVDTAMKVFCV